MREIIAVTIGILIVPLIPATTIAVVNFLRGGFYSDVKLLADLMPGFYGSSLLLTVIIALPAALLMRKLGLARKVSAVIVGCTIGVAIAIVASWRASFDLAIINILILGLTGAVSGFVFWLIWKQSVPNSS